MKIVTLPARGLAMLALVMFVSGCADPTLNSQGPVEVSGPPPSASEKHDHDHGDHDGHDHDEHGHGEEHQGPHGGHVIELGRNHMYHAELVENDEASSLTVYILDKDMKELAIDQASIVMNLKVDGQAKSFNLTASETAGGVSSRFDQDDKSLFESLHLHEATGKLRVIINGSPYTGDVEHHHHGEHDHDHGDAHKH